MNGDELTLESARALLSNITDAQALRNKHAGIVTQENREHATQENKGDLNKGNRGYNTKENREDVFNSDKDKKFDEQLSEALPGSDADKFGDSLDKLSNEQVKEAFSKLIVK